MNFDLLKNKVYLTLLAFYDNKIVPSYSNLGKEIGITRQTASTKMKELIEKDLITIDELNILKVSNPLNIDKELLQDYLVKATEFNPIELKRVLFFKDGYTPSTIDIAKSLNMSKGTAYAKTHSVIYAIVVDGIVKYIGTSSRFEKRISEHIRNRSFLTKENFIILKDDVGKDSFFIENQLILLLQPEWNKMP